MSDGRHIASSQREISLVEILDRALGAGVVITGDVTISLADIDLVYLNLRLLVGSVGTIRAGSRREPDWEVEGGSRRDLGAGRLALGPGRDHGR